MQPLVILRIIGLLLMIFSTTVIPPVLVSLWYQDTETVAFINAFLVIFVEDAVMQKSKITDGEAEVVDTSEEGKKWADYLENLSPDDFGKYKI